MLENTLTAPGRILAHRGAESETTMKTSKKIEVTTNMAALIRELTAKYPNGAIVVPSEAAVVIDYSDTRSKYGPN